MDRLFFVCYNQTMMKIKNKNQIISITGKSGSGKTYIARMLAARLCAELVSFDEISHDSLENNEIISKIRSIFGNSVFDANKINRKKLGQIVFADNQKLDFLNNICQAKMEEIIDAKINNSKNTTFIFEYSLLPKMKYFEMSKCKILIKADSHIRKSRILSRDNISEEYFNARENNSIEYDESKFDIIIDNNENLDFDKIIKNIKEILCSEKQR